MENTTLEQPVSTDLSSSEVSEPIATTNEATACEISQETGSTYGKFKDATSLLNAYTSLEKEFTKKSQKLAELLKSTESSISNVSSYEKNEASSSLDNNLSTYTNQENSDTPKFKNKNWRVEVAKFFEQIPEAKQYSMQIANTIMSDKKLANSDNCLMYAYALEMLKNKVEPASTNDPKQIEMFANNEKVKDIVIKNYLASVLTNKSNIKVISGEASSISPSPSPSKPKNLKEASNILKKLLQS